VEISVSTAEPEPAVDAPVASPHELLDSPQECSSAPRLYSTLELAARQSSRAASIRNAGRGDRLRQAVEQAAAAKSPSRSNSYTCGSSPRSNAIERL